MIEKNRYRKSNRFLQASNSNSTKLILNFQI
jgi:hypothetical protein